jgi:hypothetical protein
MSWFGRAIDDWRRALEGLNTTVNEKPNPAAVEILGNIDLLLKTASKVKTHRFLRFFRFLFPLVATVGLAYVMFSTCAHNTFALSVTASAVSFTLDSDGEVPVLKELSLTRLVANPVNAFVTCNEKGNALASSSFDQESRTAVLVPARRMRLDALPLPAGTVISLFFPQRQRGLKIVLEYPRPRPSEISGTAEGAPDGRSCDFTLKAQGKALELTIIPEDSDLSEPVDGQIPISTIQFGTRRLEPGKALSSIETGALSFSDIPDAKYSLGRGTRLSLAFQGGTLAELRVVPQQLSLLLQGDASKVRLGYRDQKDITPTKLDWLRSRARNIELWMGLVYIALILWGLGLPEFKGSKS